MTANKNEKTDKSYKKLTNIFAEELVSIAYEDLESSKILLEHKKYSQSVFLLQQSIEKASKSLGLILGLFTVPDTKSKIGHNSLNIIKDSTNEFIDKQKKIKENQDVYDLTKKLASMNNVDYEKISNDCIDNQDNFNNFLKDAKSKYDFKWSEIRESLKQLKELNTSYNKSIEAIKSKKLNYKLWMKNIDNSKSKIIDGMKQLLIDADLSEDEKNLRIQSTIDELGFNKIDDKLLNQMSKIIVNIFIAICALGIVLQLSMIFSSQEQRTRYPSEDTKFNPLEYYNDKLPLVRNLDKFQEYTKASLDMIKELMREYTAND